MSKVRFRDDTHELMCGAACDPHPRHGDMACHRTDGHPGEHISIVCNAAAADGVCHACRLPIGAGHRDDCFAKRASDGLDELVRLTEEFGGYD